MSTQYLICANCGYQSPPGTTHCPRCGTAIAPDLVAELQWLYRSLGDLNRRITAGEGDRTIVALRDEYAERYLQQRMASPAPTPAKSTDPSVASTPVIPAAPLVASTSATSVPPPARSTTVRVRRTPNMAHADPAAHPPGPAFTWQAFLADQAIAIIAYMGGFLLLIATLTFIVSTWQGFADGIKLAVVGIVYGSFAGLGFVLRRMERLQTVGNVYLSVFALMTPLVALAIYRFALQMLAFPVSGMLCVASFYAALVYLALAWRTRFVTYAYLGWVALAVALQAAVLWAKAPAAWQITMLAATSLILLLPHQSRTPREIIALPALQLASLLSLITLIAAELQALNIITATDQDTGAFALTASILVPLALLWSTMERDYPQWGRVEARTALALAPAVLAAQAILGIAAWAGADHPTIEYLVALLAIAEYGATWSTMPRFSQLTPAVRRGMQGFALILVVAGILTSQGDPLPNWHLVALYGAGMVVTLLLAVREHLPWWTLATGIFASFGYYHITANLAPTASSQQASYFQVGFTLVLALLALGMGFSRRTQPYATSTYVVAGGNALYALPILAALDATYGTAVLSIFATIAFLAARREQQPFVGQMMATFFGLLAVSRFIFASSNPYAIVVVAPVLWLIVLGLQRWLGRSWIYGAYILGLWATFLGALRLAIPFFAISESTNTALALLGIPLVVWFLLICAVLAGIVGIIDRMLSAMIAPALMGWGAVLATRDPLTIVVLDLALVGTGVMLSTWQGRRVSVLWYGVAVLGSYTVAERLHTFSSNGIAWEAIFLLGFGAIGYLIAVKERLPWITAIAVVYVSFSLLVMPGPDNLLPTLALGIGAVALGIGLRRRAVPLPWVAAFYGSGIVASVFAINRVQPFDANHVEMLLLLFAALAYVVAVLERSPYAGIAPALYATVTIFYQQDAHALLPLALALATIGLVTGRIGDVRWSWPPYAAAAVVAATSAAHAQQDLPLAAISLAIMALTTYVIAAAESRPDILAGALMLGGIALAVADDVWHLTGWQSILTFAALAWLYAGGLWLWRAIPWLRLRGGAWWDAASIGADPRATGAWVHRWGSIITGIGAAGAAILLPDSFAPQQGATQAAALTLFSLGGLLLLYGLTATRPALFPYLAGLLVAIGLSWELRWLGADNLQAYVLPPGSYLLLIGALLPTDQRVSAGRRAGQGASLLGALLILLPALQQTLVHEEDLANGVFMAVEAITISGIGLGTRARLLVAVGLSFMGIAALLGAKLAVDKGTPVALVIGLFAVFLLGVATWLSLRARQGQP